MKNLKRPIILLLLGVAVCTCIDPYFPDLDPTESLLVVDAQLTNENRSYLVKLSRTKAEKDAEPVMVSGAFVSIREENGVSASLHEYAKGTYMTDSSVFRGEVGKSYILYVRTPDGNEYESSPCLMYPAGQIDSVYFAGDQEITNNGNKIQDGLRIYINTEISDGCKYYRWDNEEWWKFRVPAVKRYDYIDQENIPEVVSAKEYCWKHAMSDPFSAQFIESSQIVRIEKKPVLFIPSDESDRLLIRYYIELRQLSISPDEYEFWTQMKKINDSGGNIFDIQPFPVVSNIHNLKDPNEAVLGYFKVSAAVRKGIYINKTDLDELGMKFYLYPCESIEAEQKDYSSPSFFVSFDMLYKLFVYPGSPYAFVRPVYERLSLVKLIFAKKECTDCTLTGNSEKPDFWTD